MSHARALRFESLEARELLSGAGPMKPGAAHAVTAAPLVLSGTLTVDNQASTTSMDEEEDTITSTPVSGQLGTLGKVHGVWTESADQYGDYLGPDTIKIHTAKGTFVVAFSEEHTSNRHRVAGGALAYEDPQIASQGTGAYAGAKESGSIELTTNKSRTLVETMAFSTQ